MNKRIWVILICLILFVGCSKTEIKSTGWKEYDLRGKIKSLKDYSYEAIEEDGEIKRGERARNDIIKMQLNDYEVHFSEDGLVTEVKVIKSDDQVYVIKTYQYNDKDKVMEEIIEFEDSVVYKKYQYDEKGHPLRLEIYENEVMTCYSDYTCDSQGYIIMDDYNDLVMKEQSITTQYTYDKNHNKIKREAMRVWQGVETHFIDENTYNEDNQLVSKKVENPVADQTISYTYNEYGDLIKHVSIISDPYTTEYTYEYDTNNNWIHRIERVNGQPNYIVEREIEYYD